MRKLKIIEHISLDGVIQVAGEDGDFPYDDSWSGFWPKAPSSPMADRLRRRLNSNVMRQKLEMSDRRPRLLAPGGLIIGAVERA